jgi:hypothetical protein
MQNGYLLMKEAALMSLQPASTDLSLMPSHLTNEQTQYCV